MPLLKLETTVTLTADQEKALLASLSQIIVQVVGKPEQYVMVSFTPARMLMSGQSGEAAWVEVRSIGGLNDNVNRQLAREICAVLKGALEIPPERVYLNFTDVEAGNWGWNGETFG